MGIPQARISIADEIHAAGNNRVRIKRGRSDN